MGRATGCDVIGQALGQRAQSLNMVVAVRQRHVGQIGQWGLALQQLVGQPSGAQVAVDGLQTFRAFRVPLTHLVLTAVAVGEITCSIHGAQPVVFKFG